MTYKATAPDGRVIFVDGPEGLGDKEIIQLARAQRQMVGQTAVAKPGEKVIQMPSPSSAIAQRLKERAGDILATTGAVLAPGSGLRGLALRVLGAEAGQDIGQAATGQKVTPGFGAATQLVGEGVTRAVSPLLSPTTYRAFANRTAKAAGAWLKEKIPAWASFSSDAKGMYEMAHVTGPRRLHEGFDTALTTVKKQAGNAPVMLLEEDAKALGLKLKPATIIQKPTAAAGPAPVVNLVQVPADQTIDAVVGTWKKEPALYRRTINALMPELDKLNLGQTYHDARREYQIGAGFIEHATKGKYLYHERFDPVKAHQALDTFGQSLMRRGMDEFRAILRGPGAKPVEAVPHHPFLRRIEGTLAGGAAGAAFGVPHAIGGAAGGLVAAGALPTTTYRNVPLTPAARFAGRLAPAVVGEGAREAARELGVTEQLPGYGP